MYRSRNTSFSLKIFTIIILVIFAFACKKDEEETPPPQGNTIFYSDFSGGSQEGFLPVTGNWNIENNVYKVDHDTTLYSQVNLLEGSYESYSVEVKARKMNAHPCNVGIQFNIDTSKYINDLGNWSNAYKLIICNDGRWSIGKTIDSEWTYFDLDTVPNPNLNAGEGKWNVMKVTYADGNIQVFFNGISQGTYQDNSLSSGQIAISMFDPDYMGLGEFDYVLVTMIEKDYPFDLIKKGIDLSIPTQKGYQGDCP